MVVEIPLTRGYVALVDVLDAEKVLGRKWRCQISGSRRWAASGQSRTHNAVLMHRLILDAPPGMHVDHRDHDGLNNRRENLRLCTRSQNLGNRLKQSPPASSRYKGVTWRKVSRKWMARIRQQSLGVFATEAEAARVYNQAALQVYGKFALLNEVVDD